MFFKIGILKSFAKFIGKYLRQSLRPATLLNKRLWDRCFPVNFAKILRTPFFLEHPPVVEYLKGIPHRLLLLVQEQLLRATVPFQSNAFNSSYLSYQLFFEIAIFLSSYFSEQAIFLNSYLQEQPPEGFYKKLFLKISQYLQENTHQGCNFIKKRLKHRCFPANISKFLRIVI